jgi:hypothetical protein
MNCVYVVQIYSKPNLQIVLPQTTNNKKENLGRFETLYFFPLILLIDTPEFTFFTTFLTLEDLHHQSKLQAQRLAQQQNDQGFKELRDTIST